MTVYMDEITLWTLIAGWIVCALFALFLIVLMRFTPAMRFFKARFFGKKIVMCWNRAGESEFLEANQRPGTLETHIGPFALTEGSQVVDRKSKLAIYFAFNEFAYTVDKKFPIILQELRELGYKIDTNDDYNHWIKIAKDEKYRKSFVDGITDDRVRKQLLPKIEKISKINIEIKPYKTYKMHELLNMFPSAVSPQAIEIRNRWEIQRLIQKYGPKNMNVTMVWIIIMIVVLFSGVIAYNMLHEPEVTCNVVQSGIAYANATASTLTV